MTEQSRRHFMSQCATMVGASAVIGVSASATSDQALRNWAGNYRYSTERLTSATSLADVQAFVRRHERLKVLGTRHCFNGIADSADGFLSLREMNRVVELDEAGRRVTIEAGMSYGQLCPYLDQRGFALHNLASLPHISVAGACATATHGSGPTNGNLSTAVAALEIVTAGGDVVSIGRDRDPDVFQAAVVHLGAIGVVTKVTLDLQPAFTMRQDVYLDLPMAQVREHFEEIVVAGYSVSLFTDWQHGRINEVWVKRRVEKDAVAPASKEFYGARPAKANVHPIVELSAENCTEQMGIPGPWFERLPHFRLEFTPSSGEELQSEYILPRQHAFAAFQVIHDLRDRISPLLQISEVRTIAADELWMSPSYGQDCVAIHFTWKQDWQGVKQVLPLIEERFTHFEARPHWGKLFTMSPDHLQSLYSKLPEFRGLLQRYDPEGKFRNGFLDNYIFDS
jgi:xylitol oxidase